MNSKTLDQVLNELRDERHAPMVRLAESLRLQDWIAELDFNLSMLRL
ncbi:MAG: hypothetical protein QM784_40265 [Polyangiaceae bacterium]